MREGKEKQQNGGTCFSLMIKFSDKTKYLTCKIFLLFEKCENQFYKIEVCV